MHGFKKRCKNKYGNLSEKEKNKKRKYQRERYHINTDLNERLKQNQRNYYASKIIFHASKLQIPSELISLVINASVSLLKKRN